MKPTFNNYIAEQNINTQLNQEARIASEGEQSPLNMQDFTGVSSPSRQSMDMPQSQQNMMEVQPHQQIMPSEHGNPFSMEQYKNVNLPDVPVQFGGGIADNLLNDNEVPEEIKKKYWFVFHKDNVLTFLDDNRQKRKLLNFDIMKIDALNTMPYYDYTFEKELEFDVLRNVFETKLDRALGFRGNNLKNERIMLQSQFSENRQISEMGGQPTREGFFKRLLGRR